MTHELHKGRCLCGAVTFEATGPAKWTGYCHCQSCRRSTGAPVSAFAGFERAAVRWTGEPPASHASSPGVLRRFCGRCGATLSCEGDRWPGELHIHVGAFDAPEAFPPTAHAFIEERVPWLHLSDPPPP